MSSMIQSLRSHNSRAHPMWIAPLTDQQYHDGTTPRTYSDMKGEWHPFVDRIMEVDLPLGWKPLNLEHYDGTTNLDKHLDVFLSLDNLYTNDDMILCRVFPTPLKEWCWHGLKDSLPGLLTVSTPLSTALTFNTQWVDRTSQLLLL